MEMFICRLIGENNLKKISLKDVEKIASKNIIEITTPIVGDRAYNFVEFCEGIITYINYDNDSIRMILEGEDDEKKFTIDDIRVVRNNCLPLKEHLFATSEYITWKNNVKLSNNNLRIYEVFGKDFNYLIGTDKDIDIESTFNKFFVKSG